MSTELVHVRRAPSSVLVPARSGSSWADQAGRATGRAASAAGCWPLDHWLWSGCWLVVAVVLGWLWRWEAGALVAGVFIGVPATVAGLLLPTRPVLYRRAFADPLIALRWAVWWLIRYERAALEADLGRRPRRWATASVTSGDAPSFKAARCWPAATARGLELRIRVPQGLSAEDVERRVPAFAAAMRAKSYSYRRVHAASVTVRLTMVDALAATVVAPVFEKADVPVVLGVDEAGSAVVVDPREPMHLAMQGQTRSGKSTATYVALAGVARRSDVVVVGCDPSGILLTPWKAGRGGSWIATGTQDMERHALVLEAIVREMDHRVSWLTGAGLDKLTEFDAVMPVLWVVLEEWPGTLAAARAADKDVAARIERAHGRIVKEGAKAGVIAFTLAQRMSARAMDSDDRSNYGVRITLRVDNGDSIRMMHDGAAVPGMEEIRSWPAGLGIVERPGVPLTRWRAFLLDYAGYRTRVRRGLAGQAGVGGWCAAPIVAPVVTVTSTSTGTAAEPDAEPVVIQGETVERPQRPRRRQPKQPRQNRPSAGEEKAA